MSEALTSKRPYLVRAMYEWISDNGLTPHIVIDAAYEGLSVPSEYVTDGKLVLNISRSATRGVQLGNDAFAFEVRFGGVPMQLEIPPAAVLGIYARETGQGMIFASADPPSGDDAPETGKAAQKPKLSVVK